MFGLSRFGTAGILGGMVFFTYISDGAKNILAKNLGKNVTGG